MATTYAVQQAPMGQPQPVVYMMQNPDGSMVPVQVQGAVQPQTVMYSQPMGAVATTQNTGISYVAPGTVSAPGEAPGTQTTVITQTVVQQGRVTRAPIDYNKNAAGWGMFVIIIAYVCDIWALAADELLFYEYEDDTYGQEEVVYTHDSVKTEGWFWTTNHYRYSYGCNAGDDDYCTLEDKGDTWNTFRVLSNVLLIVAMVLIFNVFGQCCYKEYAIQFVRGAGVCSMLALLCGAIAMLVWLTDNPVFDAIEETVEWAQSLYAAAIEAILLIITPFLLFQRRKPLH